MAGSRRQQRVVAQELEKVSLGDPRRERRAVALAERLAADPEATLPFAMVDRAMLEAAYRHLSTRVVTFDALLAPHVEKTAARVGEAGDVYAVHDTTICMFSGEVQPSGLGTVNLADQGFLAHTSRSRSRRTARGFHSVCSRPNCSFEPSESTREGVTTSTERRTPTRSRSAGNGGSTGQARS